MKPYYEDDTVTLIHADALAGAKSLGTGSVKTIVTSPPYFGLRDYGEEEQIGNETMVEDYVSRLQDVFHELIRVLDDGGTLWLNLGDSYSRKKSLLGIPWRVVFALQEDGWLLRNSIIWHKPNAMPESVSDRLAGRHENIFLLSRRMHHDFDLGAVRTPHAESTIASATRARIPYTAPGQKPNAKTRSMHPSGANPGDVWSVNNTPFPGAHFATFPQEIPRRCVLMSSVEGDTVLDPFSGSGTTGMVATQEGRKYIGIDLSSEYLDLSIRERFAQPVLNFGDIA